MAITTMTSKDKYEALLAAGSTDVSEVTNYPGAQKYQVGHAKECPHYAAAGAGYQGYEIRPEGLYSDCCTEGVYSNRCHFRNEGLYMHTTHQGLVLSLGERNWHDDSDFYATVWNPETNAPEKITYATTRGWTYPNHASVDATPEVRAAYEAFLENIRKARAQAAAEERANTVAKGKRVKVVKGRKVPVGTEGVVFWTGPDKYNRNVTRAGLKDAAGVTHWVDAGHCQVVR